MNYLIKIGPYDPQQIHKTRYDSVADLTMGKNDPELDSQKASSYVFDKQLLSSFNLIFCSELARARTTYDFLLRQNCLAQTATISFEKNLDEIKFDIRPICSKELYDKQRSNIIRSIFLNGIINDQLLESRQEIHSRINNIENIIKDYPDKNILLISHTFFTKLFLINRKHPGFLIHSPELIKRFIDPERRIMDFFELNRILD